MFALFHEAADKRVLSNTRSELEGPRNGCFQTSFNLSVFLWIPPMRHAFLPQRSISTIHHDQVNPPHLSALLTVPSTWL